jgi:hypothetical protein
VPGPDLVQSVVLLVVPRDQPQLARALTERFAGVPGLHVIEDRRRPWPQGERRRRGVPVAEVATDRDRRREQRRGSDESCFLAVLVDPSRR